MVHVNDRLDRNQLDSLFPLGEEVPHTDLPLRQHLIQKLAGYLWDCLEELRAAEAHYTSGVLSFDQQGYGTNYTRDDEACGLTGRQLEILGMVAEGITVSNQQKWDTLGAERSGAGWRSGELPEGPVVASSPFGGLSLHLLPAL